MAANPCNGKTKAGESWFQGQLRLSEEKNRKGKRKLDLKRVVDLCSSCCDSEFIGCSCLCSPQHRILVSPKLYNILILLQPPMFGY